MSRPSTHTDQLLIKSARRLYPNVGCKRLNLRDVAKKAGVNLGMFHYHFKTKDEFIRRVFQDFYEEFLGNFDLSAIEGDTPIERLRSVLVRISFFVRDNGAFMSALMVDLMNGESLAVQFAKKNFARHIKIMMQLIDECQAGGYIEPLPTPEVLFLFASGIVFPSLAASRVKRISQVPKQVKDNLSIITRDQAMLSRIDCILKGISAPKRKSK